MADRNTDEIIAELVPEPCSTHAGYEQFIFRWDRPFFVERVEMAGFTGGDLALDAGCGFGQFSYALAQLNTRVFAIDRAANMCERARALVQKWGAPNVVVEQCALPTLPYGDAIFDFIWCSNVLTFIDRDAAMCEFARLLRPGGRLYVMMSSWGRWLFRAARAQVMDDANTLRKALGVLSGAPGAAGNNNCLELDDVPALCARYGFDLIAAGAEGTLDLTGAGRVRSMFAPRVLLQQEGEEAVELDSNIEFIAERAAG